MHPEVCNIDQCKEVSSIFHVQAFVSAGSHMGNVVQVTWGGSGWDWMLGRIDPN